MGGGAYASIIIVMAVMLVFLPGPGGQAQAAKPRADVRVLVQGAAKAAAEGDTARAIQMYRAALAQEPGDARIIRSLAGLEQRVGNTRNAARLWGRILDANPRDAEACVHLGEVYIKEENFASAVEYFERAEEQSPAGSAVYAAARKGLDDVMAHSRYYRARIIQGRAKRLQMQMDAEARERQAAALSRQVGLYRSMIAQGRQLFSHKRYQEALETYNMVLQLAPDNAEAARLKQAAVLAMRRESDNAAADAAIGRLMASQGP